ncbi:MAG TPA: hypothetical protein DEP99_04185, partial [Nitrospiraceae bacterium]|nr:hypothetical protein [Nitrospiraceae bacterium]
VYMPLFGTLFVSELIKKPVLDPSGEDPGFVRDFIVVRGEPLPRLSALIVEKKKVQYYLNWEDLSIFN